MVNVARHNLAKSPCLCVHLKRKHDFWRPVPPGGDILRHQPELLPLRIRGLDASGQAKVAHFEVTVRVEQKIGRLQIPMDDVRAVNRLERPEDLIYEVLF